MFSSFSRLLLFSPVTRGFQLLHVSHFSPFYSEHSQRTNRKTSSASVYLRPTADVCAVTAASFCLHPPAVRSRRSLGGRTNRLWVLLRSPVALSWKRGKPAYLLSLWRRSEFDPEQHVPTNEADISGSRGGRLRRRNYNGLHERSAGRCDVTSWLGFKVLSFAFVPQRLEWRRTRPSPGSWSLWGSLRPGRLISTPAWCICLSPNGPDWIVCPTFARLLRINLSKCCIWWQKWMLL